MLRQSRHAEQLFDRNDLPVLRTAAKTLRLTLERFIEQLGSGEENFAEVEQLYRTECQPIARGLVRALLTYVPDDDPRIMVMSAIDGTRQFKSDDMNSVDTSLTKGVAETQLRGIHKQIGELVAYLP